MLRRRLQKYKSRNKKNQKKPNSEKFNFRDKKNKSRRELKKK